MFEAIGRTGSHTGDRSARAVLSAARSEQAAARLAEARMLQCALAWASLHPSSGLTAQADDAAVFFDATGVEPISGTGCPGVAEYSIAEFGSELGMSTTAAKRLIGHALELAHRLPRLWRRVVAGEVEPWRARRVAEVTIHAHPRLTPDAADWVDAQVAPFAGRVGQAQVERLLDAAVERFRLSADTPDLDEVTARLHVTVANDVTGATGTLDVSATLTTADALDLEHALRSGAEQLRALGSTEPLGARRARSLGLIARRQTALDLASLRTSDEGTPAADPTSASGGRTLPPARRLDLYLHFAAGTIGHAGEPEVPGANEAPLDVAPLGSLENGQHLVLLEQVKSWFADTHTEVRVLPVIDLDEELTSSGYVPSPRLRRQVQLRDHTCVFPWCARPARACDLDHVVHYDPGRPRDVQTRTRNLASLCRSHHRLKTHSGWRLTTLSSGVFEWTSPHGHRYRRDSNGTVRVQASPQPQPQPDPPPELRAPLPHVAAVRNPVPAPSANA